MATRPCKKYLPDPVPVGVDPKLSAWLKREFERVQQGICCCDDSFDQEEPCTTVDLSRASFWDGEDAAYSGTGYTGVEVFSMGTGDTDVEDFEGFSATEDLSVDPGLGEIVFPETRAYAVEFNGTFIHEVFTEDVPFKFWLAAGSDNATPIFTYQINAETSSTQISFRYHIYPAAFYVDNGFAFKFRIGRTDGAYFDCAWLNKIVTVESIGPSGAACQDTSCQGAGFDDPNITWSESEEAWLLMAQNESIVSFVEPVRNRGGLDWWFGVQPASLTISFYVETPPGSRTTTLTVRSTYWNALASINLDDYDYDQWNTVALPLSWSNSVEWIDDIRVESTVAGGEEYPVLLKVCPNDPPYGWGIG